MGRDREAFDIIAQKYLQSPRELAALPSSIAQTERAIRGAPDPAQRSLLQRELMGMRRAMELNGGANALNVNDLMAPIGSAYTDSRTWDKRADGSQKGRGFLGLLRRPDGGVSSEISIGVNFDGKEVEIPTMVPTLTRQEVDALLKTPLTNGDSAIPQPIIDKAVAYARQRMAQGKSPFASENESPLSPQSSGDFSDILSELGKPAESKGVLAGLADASLGAAKSAGNAIRNTLAGQIRGAGSIGATAMRLLPNALGGDTAEENAARRTSMDDFLRDTIGANPKSFNYNVGKLGGEIAGTAGVGGLAALPLRAAGIAPGVVAALESGGFATGGPTSAGFGARAADLALRAGAGAVVGGLSSGMVDPSSAGKGAMIGAALPVGVKIAGDVGSAIYRGLSGPAQTPEVEAAIRAARDAGYVIPPTQANPSLPNRLLEGVSGKISTAQNASARNQSVTNNLIKNEIGLPPDAPLTLENLDAVRAQAGQTYGVISKLGKLNASGADLPKSIDVISRRDPMTMSNTTTVDAGEVVRAWKQANSDANAYYRAYARDANPETLAKAKSALSDAKQIDGFLEKQLSAAGQDDLLQSLKNARVLIAKTYSVEKALNPITGNVDARKLAGDLKKGKILSGGLLQAGEFAGRFPKAAQMPEGMGSLPQVSPLDWAVGATGAAAGNPAMAAAMLTRPLTRAATLSPFVQNRLIPVANQGQTIQNINSFLANPVIRNALYSSAANP
jgi:hypothetical protein